MKQKFILSIVAIAFSVLSVSAQDKEKLVVNAGNTEHISIANDMNIVLMPNGDLKAYPVNSGEQVKIKYLSDWLAKR